MRIVEVQGLRGIALLMVVLFHLFGNGKVSGGVDVFLVISGFVVTLSLLKRMDGEGLKLSAHYKRTLMRLLPPAMIVIGASLATAHFLLSPTRLVAAFQEGLASLLYYENFELISSQLTYEAAGVETSPFQHYWSLAIQGQFILLFPLICFILWKIAKKIRIRSSWLLILVLSLTAAASFAYAIYSVGQDQEIAYFHTFGRVWEILVGALLAFIPRSMPKIINGISCITGLGLIVTCGFLVDGQNLFPGLWTLWPVLGTCLVILSLGKSFKFSPQRILALKPLQRLADFSYELYLVHWPIMIFFLVFTGKEKLTLLAAAAIFVCSLLLAWILNKMSHLLTRKGKVLFTAIIFIALLCSILGGQKYNDYRVERQMEELAAQAEALANAPAVITPRIPSKDATLENIIPNYSIAEADYDTGSFSNGCIVGGGDSSVKICDLVIGSPNAPRVFLVGASHDYQFDPAWQNIAKKYNWSLSSISKGGCRFGDSRWPEDNDCTIWSANVMATLEQELPDFVITLGSATLIEGIEQFTPGSEETIAQLTASGIRVITVRDNPRFPTPVPACIEANGVDSDLCSRKFSELYKPEPPLLALGNPAVSHLDFTDLYCDIPEDVCYPVIDKVLLYRDHDHLTSTFVKTMTPYIEDKLRAVLPELTIEYANPFPPAVARLFGLSN